MKGTEILDRKRERERVREREREREREKDWLCVPQMTVILTRRDERTKTRRG